LDEVRRMRKLSKKSPSNTESNNINSIIEKQGRELVLFDEQEMWMLHHRIIELKEKEYGQSMDLERVFRWIEDTSEGEISLLDEGRWYPFGKKAWKGWAMIGAGIGLYVSLLYYIAIVVAEKEAGMHDFVIDMAMLRGLL